MRFALILPVFLAASCAKPPNVIDDVILEATKKKAGELTQKDLASITGLYLHDRGITDLSPLEKLPNVEELWLADNRITDLSPLAGMAKLKTLDLQNNQITDLTPLAKLKALRNLFLKNNPVKSAEIDKLKKALPQCGVIYNAKQP